MPFMAKYMSLDTELNQHNANRTQNGMRIISDRDTAIEASECKDSSLDIIARQPHPGVPTAIGAPATGFSRGAWDFRTQFSRPPPGTNLFEGVKNPVSNFKGQGVFDKPMPQSPPLNNSMTGLGNFGALPYELRVKIWKLLAPYADHIRRVSFNVKLMRTRFDV